MPTSLKFATLDVFTSTPYSGNPVAIIHVPLELRHALTTEQKQLIAREFNLSESVFLHDQTEEERNAGDVKIDIFTPFAEVPFAGHPTIGTSNYLLKYLRDNPQWTAIRALQAKAGRMPIELVSVPIGSDASQSSQAVRLSVAHNVHIHQNRLSQPDVIASFPTDARTGFDLGSYPIVSSVRGMTFILAQMGDLDKLRDLPRENIIGTNNTYKSSHLLDEGWQVGILPTYFFVDLGQSSTGIRTLRSRMMGSREDPATGSAASALCAYLSLSGEGPLTRRYEVIQGVEMGRESHIGVDVKLRSDKKSIETLHLSGTAVKTMEGHVEVPSQTVLIAS